MFRRTVANGVLDLGYAVIHTRIHLALLAYAITANTLVLVAHAKDRELVGRRIVKGVPLKLQCPH